jgi:hypothetical protein
MLQMLGEDLDKSMKVNLLKTYQLDQSKKVFVQKVKLEEPPKPAKKK